MIWIRRLFILALFGALVVVLLWFQGILFRKELTPVDVPGPRALQANERTFRVERRAFSTDVVHPGFVRAVDPATLAPRVMAAVLEVSGREGEVVREGAPVVTLDDRDARAKLAQARAALAAAEAQALHARQAHDRVSRLHASDAATTQDLEGALAGRDAALAGVERARRAVEEGEAALSWFVLAAPFDGRILSRDADPGDLALPGRPLLSVYRPDRLRFEVAVPEERAVGLEPGATFELSFEGLGERTARLARILPAADSRTGTVLLHLDPASGEGLRPGILGRLRLPVGEREALVLPADAVERIGQIERVRLVSEGNLAPVTVRTGKRHGELVEVLSGLREGEEVLLP